MDKIIITAETNDKRADNFISAATGKSRSQIAALIESGLVLINNAPARKSSSIKAGDRIEITIVPEPLPDIAPKEIPFEIIYDCPQYAVINKPAGIAVHPAPGHYADSLVNGLLYAFNIADDDADFRPGIVHRLDKDTSGLLIVAKNRDSRETIAKMFHDRLISKHYIAIASGKPKFKELMIEEPIARDKKHRKRMTVSPDGRYAKTKLRVAETYKDAFLADIELFTGRTHQIRVHMKHIKHPLLGDELYGGAAVAKRFGRQALHAYKLKFNDPFTGENMEFTAELPGDMLELIKQLNK